MPIRRTFFKVTVFTPNIVVAVCTIRASFYVFCRQYSMLYVLKFPSWEALKLRPGDVVLTYWETSNPTLHKQQAVWVSVGGYTQNQRLLPISRLIATTWIFITFRMRFSGSGSVDWLEWTRQLKHVGFLFPFRVDLEIN